MVRMNIYYNLLKFMRKLSKNDRLTVKVLRRRQFTNKAIYEVEYEGRKFHVPMFEFQKSLPLPEELECVVSSVDGNNLYLVQNIARLLSEHYKVGQVYEFVIAEDYTRASTPHYKLTDGTGFFFKLTPPRGKKLMKNHKIRCRLRRLRNIEVDLEYLGPVHEMISGFNIPSLVRRIGPDAIRLINRYRRAEGVADVIDRYEAASPDWLPEGAEFVVRSLERVSAATLTQADLDSARALSHAIVWLMEDSDYFDNFQEAERMARLERFRRILHRTQAIEKALEIILSGRQGEYVGRMLDKVKASGYLIDAELKLRTIRNIFAIDNDLLSACIGDVIEAAIRRRANCMGDPTFRKAFVELLQIYVDSNAGLLDTMDEAETQTAREKLSVIVRVIALQLLMADDEADEGDYQLNRSRLYRYLALFNQGGEETLFEKSLNALLACETWRNEHTWKDLEQMFSLTTSLRQEHTAATLPAIYEGAQAVIKVNGSEIAIESTAGSDYVCDGLERLSLWKGLAIRLDSLLPSELRNPRTIQQYKRMWREIEHRLTITPEQNADKGVPAIPVRLALPMKGDDVEIEITGVDPHNPDRFSCRVVEEGLRGEGWINKSAITSSERDLPYSVFVDEEGRPHVFPAEVIRCNDDGTLEFSMIDIINDYLNEEIRYENEEECVILRKRVDEATCLCRKGFVLNVRLDPGYDHLDKGDVISVHHIMVSPNGNWREGEFKDVVGGRIDFNEVMTDLMAAFALKDGPAEYDDETDDYDDSTDAGDIQEASRLEAAQVCEIARIIEHVGATMRENRVAFNYFSFARMLAVLIGDGQLTEYYTKRCALLEELDVFFTNGRVDLSRLENLIPDLMKDNSSLSTDVAKLRILSVLDHSDNNHRLWEMFGTDANESLQELARLVLAYNMLDGFKMRDERHAIRKKLYARLKVDIDKEPTVVADGIENLHTEFKTSTVYPANSMRIDVGAQTLVILKVICAFMNTEGGTLYIGVSDEGYVRGLEADLAYFGGRTDRFDRSIHDNLRTHMGFIPNLQLYCITEWIKIDGKEIYRVTVNPVYEPVAVDGIYYYREGSSCVMVRQGDEQRFVESRRKLGQQRGATAEARPAPAPAHDRLPERAVSTTVRNTEPAPERTRFATSALRNNVLHDGYDGFTSVSSYLYIFPGLDFEMVDYDKWMEESTALTLGLHPSETAGDLLIVSSDGYVVRTAIESLADSERRFSSRLKPVYIAPVRNEDSIIAIYRDSSGGTFKRLFRVDEIRHCKPEERGEMLSRDIEEILFCESMTAEEALNFKPLVRKQRISKDDDSVRRESESIISRLGGKV